MTGVVFMGISLQAQIDGSRWPQAFGQKNRLQPLKAVTGFNASIMALPVRHPRPFSTAAAPAALMHP